MGGCTQKSYANLTKGGGGLRPILRKILGALKNPEKTAREDSG